MALMQEQGGHGVTTDTTELRNIAWACRTGRQPSRDKIGSGRMAHNVWQKVFKAAKHREQPGVRRLLLQERGHECGDLVEDGGSDMQSTDTCSAPGTHRSDGSSHIQARNGRTPRPQRPRANQANKADKIQEAIDGLKEHMEVGLSLVEDALQETSSLKAEFSILQSELRQLCNAYILDELPEIEESSGEFQLSSCHRGTKQDSVGDICDSEGERENDAVVINAINDGCVHLNDNNGTVLERITSTEMCGSQEFQSANLVAGLSSLRAEESMIEPITVSKEWSSSLGCAHCTDFLTGAEGVVSFPSASLHSKASVDGVGERSPLQVCSEHGSMGCGSSVCEDDHFDLCDFWDNVLSESSNASSCNNAGDVVCSNFGWEWSEHHSPDMIPGQPSVMDEDSASNADAHPLQDSSLISEEPQNVESDFCNFADDSLCYEEHTCTEGVEVFEHCSCDAIDGHGRMWGDGGLSAWIDLDGILPLGMVYPGEGTNDEFTVGPSPDSAWDLSGVCGGRGSPAESLILADIENQAPRVVSGTWDSARRYQTSRAVVHNVTLSNVPAENSQDGDLLYDSNLPHDHGVVKTVVVANNFDTDKGGWLPTQEVSRHEVMTPTRVENNGQMDIGVESSSKNEACAPGFGRPGVSILGTCPDQCLNEKGTNVPFYLADCNKTENDISGVAGGWLGRVCQGISSLAIGLRNNGSTEDTGLCADGKQEFELVGMKNQVCSLPCTQLPTFADPNVEVCDTGDQTWLWRIWDACQGLVQLCVTQYQITCGQ